MSSATPRWVVEPLQWSHGADLAIVCNGHVVAEIRHDPDLQTDDEPNMNNVVLLPQDFANAAVLATAPRLRAALKNMVSELERILGNELPTDHEAKLALRAASVESVMDFAAAYRVKPESLTAIEASA